MARASKARVEGAVSDAVRQGVPADLNAIVETFKLAHPAEWEAIRLCPTQHGLEVMIERLSHG